MHKAAKMQANKKLIFVEFTQIPRCQDIRYEGSDEVRYCDLRYSGKQRHAAKQKEPLQKFWCRSTFT